MGKGYNHHDYMDIALAPIEAQRDDAWEELNKVKAERDALLAALESVMGFIFWEYSFELAKICTADGDGVESTEIRLARRAANAASDKAKGGE